MLFEWDIAKNKLNLLKHGVDFETAQTIFDGVVIEYQDTRKDYGETRIGAFGIAGNTLLFVVFTWRGNCRRIISARSANTKERTAYHAKIKH